MQKIVLFGAGKIGRSLIGQLFSRSGFEVIFIDISTQIIEELNKRNAYKVVIKADKEETINIKNVRGLLLSDKKNVIKEIITTNIVGISVGQKGLHEVIRLLADGLIERFKTNSKSPLDIIIAENLRNAKNYFKKKLNPLLPRDYPFDQLVGLIETSIGKMVPIMPELVTKEDSLLVYAESYNKLILDKKGFKNPIPKVEGLAPKENIKAWVDRKLFIHNLGHATVAYYGSFRHPNATYIYEVLADLEVFNFSKKVMLQSAEILRTYYPDDYSDNELKAHIDDLLIRFQNEGLKDTIYRVGQDRIRKLGPDDRFVGLIHLAEEKNLNYDCIIEAMTYAFQFNAKDECGNISESDILFDKYLLEGAEYLLQKVCGFYSVKNKRLIEVSLGYINKTLKYHSSTRRG